MKPHSKIKHDEKVCHAQEWGPYAQGLGHNQLRGHIVPQMCLSNNFTEVNLMKLHRKIMSFVAEELGSPVQGQGNNQGSMVISLQ